MFRGLLLFFSKDPKFFNILDDFIVLINTLPHITKRVFFFVSVQLKHSIVAGDLNAHHPSWGSHRSCDSEDTLYDFFIERNLTIFNDSTHTFYYDHSTCPVGHNVGLPSTGGRVVSSPLDLTVVSLNSSTVTAWSVFSDNMSSDYYPVESILTLKPNSIPFSIFHRLNYKNLN